MADSPLAKPRLNGLWRIANSQSYFIIPPSFYYNNEDESKQCCFQFTERNYNIENNLGKAFLNMVTR